MGRDDQLGALTHELVDARQEGELALGREGGLGFVEDVEAAPSEPVQSNPKESLT
jgi:hypothetical protein